MLERLVVDEDYVQQLSEAIEYLDKAVTILKKVQIEFSRDLVRKESK